MPETFEIEDTAREFGNDLNNLIEQAISETDGSKEAYAAIATVVAQKLADLAQFIDEEAA